MTKKFIFSFLSIFAFIAFSVAQQSILVLDSNTKRVTQLNVTDGSVLNANFIDLTTLSPGTIKGLTQVDNKIWISDQTQDAIYIYSLAGVYESTINTGLDNIRGINVVNNEVWVTNAGNANGSTSNTIVRFSKAGVNLGFYPSITSPFDVLDMGTGNALITSFSSSGIQKMSYDGSTTSQFVGSGIISNAEQINFTSNGNVLCSVFSSLGPNPAGVYEFSPTGTKLNNWPITSGNIRGVIATNGTDYLASTSTGVYKLNPSTGVSTLITAGNFQFFTKIDTSLGLNEIASSTRVHFYPNPVQDVLIIVSAEEIKNIEILAVSGQVVMKRKLNGKEVKLDISKLSSGMYIVKIQNKNLKFETFKIIKK